MTTTDTGKRQYLLKSPSGAVVGTYLSERAAEQAKAWHEGVDGLPYTIEPETVPGRKP